MNYSPSEILKGAPQVAQLNCKHGRFYVFAPDAYVARSLDLLGEYSEDEVVIASRVLKPDSVAVEVGANIGALTVPLSRLCGTLVAIEAQPENFELLRSNLANNGCTNVELWNKAVGHVPGRIEKVHRLAELGHENFGRVEVGAGAYTVATDTLDLMLTGRHVHFIKIDVEGMELDVLKGARHTIDRCRPILYVENDRQEKSADLIAWLHDQNYRCFWHRPPLFNPANFLNNPLNPWPGVCSINMICFPEEMHASVGMLDEVADERIDKDMYARAFSRAMRHVKEGVDVMEERFKAAHYANLMGLRSMARGLIAENLAVDPKHVGTRALRGLLDLQDGNFRDGWPAYELRYEQKNAAGFGFRPHNAPRWDGRPTRDRVLIWCEQGFGDTIMFSRFVREAMIRAPNAILEVQPQLYELFETSVLVDPGKLYRLGRTMPSYDWHCSIPSLPGTLGIYDEKQFSDGRPYLFADAGMVESWLRRPNRPRIGVCCRGGVASERAYSRDIPLELIEPIAAKHGPFMSLEQNGQWESYADTAAAICALDCVITVDTSVAHLAGALGVPTYLLLSSDPDWRWQMRLRADSPWYPTMTILRQREFMDWRPVIEQLDDALTRRKAKAA